MSCQININQGRYLKVVDRTDSETMEVRVPKVAGESFRMAYLSNNTPRLKVLYRFRLSQVCDGISDYISGGIGGGKKIRATRK